MFSLNVAGQDVQARIRTLGNLIPLGEYPEEPMNKSPCTENIFQEYGII
jgi:hypothetical protein